MTTDLDVCVELNEAVGPGGCVDLVPVLAVELPGQVLQEAVRHLLAELLLSQGQEASLLFYDVTEGGDYSINCRDLRLQTY